MEEFPLLQPATAETGLGRRLLEENRKLLAVAGPSICTRVSSFGVIVISQAFVGHIGPTELAAYALVSTVLMRFTNGILCESPGVVFDVELLRYKNIEEEMVALLHIALACVAQLPEQRPSMAILERSATT